MLGKVPFDVQSVNCDFASFSAHKLYGPKGLGALFVRGGARRWPWVYPFRGGGQEFALRPGTGNVPAIVGFGEACELARGLLDENARRVTSLRDDFESQLCDFAPEAIIVGNTGSRLPGTSCVMFPGVPADILLARTSDLCISSGSACASGTVSPSPVIIACGYSRDDARSVVRVSFGRYSKSDEAGRAAMRLAESAKAIRADLARQSTPVTAAQLEHGHDT